MCQIGWPTVPVHVEMGGDHIYAVRDDFSEEVS